ncbi:hypothetical protein N8D74_04385 [Curtobacterium flaccumfaciens]|uniref:Uncharacterized protein n=1 Tax=Curtobacterium poinsettiae TaxID=159612 RepID=A0A9Q9P975_9MICO|nr:hypothetical protein [Curtobacterium flaccumfaciens]UXN26125.1 hypothetical protein N8D74_04385 [Curtobacterium flaccumfaciens]UYC80967.1 hypothetical protein OE229_00465 [Curtobacterium flaccumfaciens pv. poinsettiae]
MAQQQSASSDQPRSTWQIEFLKRLEDIANNSMNPRVYTDSDGVPTAVAGAGTVSVAAWYLSSELAAKTDRPDLFADTIARHQMYVEQRIGPEAWTEVLVSTALYLNYHHLEPALALLDKTRTPLRALERQFWDSIRPSDPDDGRPGVA